LRKNVGQGGEKIALYVLFRYDEIKRRRKKGKKKRRKEEKKKEGGCL